MNRAFFIGTALIAGYSSLCPAQSFNIDFAPSGSAGPSSSYGAAGPAGFWNVLNGSTPGNLRALDGSLTSVPNFMPAILNPITQTLSGPTGDDAALLNSFYPLGDVMTQVTITGLANGSYNLIFYGLNTGNASTAWQIPPEFQFTAGAWTGHLEVGRTHVTIPATATNGTLTFGMVGSILGAGHFAGMQIVQVPGPGAGAALIATGGLLVTRRRRTS